MSPLPWERGAVYGQNVFLYNQDRKLEDYVSLAGDPNRIADRKHAFIIRADGSVFSRERAQGVLSNRFNDARINPGDSIVIPERLIKPSALRNLIDYSHPFLVRARRRRHQRGALRMGKSR